MKTKPVVGFPGYRVTDTGNVQTCWRFKGGGFAGRPTWYQSEVWLPLTPDVDKRGRRRFTLRRDGVSHKIPAAQLVLEAFVGPCPEGLEACHDNGNNSDDSLGNLRWDTHSNNLLDKRRHGTMPRGETHPGAKVTEEIVREIRRVGYPLKQHAEKHHISEALVSQILRRKVWDHVA